jgi:hypothetical protein
LALVDLAVEVFVFFLVVEHFGIVRIGKNFSAITEENNAAALVAAERL